MRRLLRAVAAVAAGFVLTACPGNGNGGGEDDGDENGGGGDSPQSASIMTR